MRSHQRFGWAGPPPWLAMAGAHGGAHGAGGSVGGGDQGGDQGGNQGGDGHDDASPWRGPQFGGPHGWGGPPGWGGWGGWGGRGRGGRGSGRARRGDVRAAVLLLLAEEPRNGYQIIQELAARSRGAWRPSPGSVYPVLQQLEDEGMVVSEAADVGRRYRLSESGAEFVRSHHGDMGLPWEEAAKGVSQPAMEFAQLIPQVIGAMKQVLHAGSERQVSQASAVLAETRRSLYRILADDAADAHAARDEPASGS